MAVSRMMFVVLRVGVVGGLVVIRSVCLLSCFLRIGTSCIGVSCL